MAPGTGPGFGSHQCFELFPLQAQPEVPELGEHNPRVPRECTHLHPHGQPSARPACPVLGHQQGAQSGKASGTPPSPGWLEMEVTSFAERLVATALGAAGVVGVHVLSSLPRWAE